MAPTIQRRIYRAIAVCTLLILAGLTTAFALRSHIAIHVVRTRLDRMARSHGLQADFTTLSVKGLSTIHIEGLRVTATHPADTILSLQTLEVKLRFLPLLRQNLEVEMLAADSLQFQWHQQLDPQQAESQQAESQQADKQYPESQQADKQYPESQQAETQREHQNTSDYSRHSRRFLRLLFDLLPADANLSRIHLIHTTDSLTLQLSLPRMELRQHTFSTWITLTENGQQQQWYLQGLIHPDKHQLQCSAVPLRAESSNPSSIPLPYLHHRLGAEVCFDSLAIGLQVSSTHSNEEQLTLVGHTSLRGLHMAHPRLSTTPVDIDSLSAQFTLHILPTAIELDSCSTLRLNLLDLHPYLLAQRVTTPRTADTPAADTPAADTSAADTPAANHAGDTHSAGNSWHFTLRLHKPWFPAQELFASLPGGLFTNLQGLRTRGELAYDLLFNLDLTNPDSLQLHSALHRRNFAIEQYGATPLDRMNDSFLYTAYEQGEPVRTFPVGPEWDHFIPLQQVPPILLTAILQSEDGGFFHHQGFLPDALREALAYDLKVGRFARGGSTITMQLVKNVFLSRNKNLARKLEEALIVWLIEQQRITSKERMLEVYLNIAEWGPLIYGLREATHYYFAKSPQALTTEESIFLATIIPRPKHWMWSFNPDGTLRDSQESHFHLLASRLAAKGLLTPAQAEAVSIRNLHLQGEAAHYFDRTNTTNPQPSDK